MACPVYDWHQGDDPDRVVHLVYRGWLAGEGRRKPETEDTRRAMAALLLELLTRP